LRRKLPKRRYPRGLILTGKAKRQQAFPIEGRRLSSFMERVAIVEENLKTGRNVAEVRKKTLLL